MTQLNFIARLFNYSDVKVQIASFCGVIASLICSFCKNFMGISATIFLLLFAVMIADYITGLRACKKEGGKFKSSRGLQWVFKFGMYIVFLAISLAIRKNMVNEGLTWVEIPMVLIHFYILFHIFIWEITSVDENLERLGYSFRILKLVTRLFKRLSGLLKNKVDETTL